MTDTLKEALDWADEVDLDAFWRDERKRIELKQERIDAWCRDYEALSEKQKRDPFLLKLYGDRLNRILDGGS